MENEIWKDIPGFIGYYQISNIGRVKSLDRYIIRNDKTTKRIDGRILKSHPDKGGYLQVVLTYKDLKKRTIKVHRLVAKTFIPNPHNKPCTNHIDGNKQNNNISNLEWVSISENGLHAYRVLKIKQACKGVYGKFWSKSIPIIQLSKDNKFIREFECANDAQRAIDQAWASSIIAVCKKKPRYITAGGYKWMYKKDYINEQENHVLYSNISE